MLPGVRFGLKSPASVARFLPLLAALLLASGPLAPAAPRGPLPAAQSSALRFDGLDDYALFEDSPRLNLRAFTLEAWFVPLGAGRPVKMGEDGLEVLPLVARGRAGAGDPLSGLNYLLGIRARDGVLVAAFQDAASGELVPVFGRTPVRGGVWSHAAATYDGARWRLFLNGTLEAEALAAGRPRLAPGSPASLATTAGPDGARAGFFEGIVDEVRLWSRAREPQEILDAMGREVERAPGLVARWGMNEGAGALLRDSAGEHPSRVVFGVARTEGSPLTVSATSSASALEGCTPTPSPLVEAVGFRSRMRYQANTGPDELILVAPGPPPMSYLANPSDPEIGLAWIDPDFIALSPPWQTGPYGIGYETALPGAVDLLQTTVTPGTFSVFTRAAFTITDVSVVKRLLLGVDYDDGYIAWINGVEVFRSPQMPAGDPAWNTNAALHESSNGAEPNFSPIQDISAAGIPALQSGQNILAIGVWNSGAPASTDLVLVPRLSIAVDWTSPEFNDLPWAPGTYGVGYETSPPGATNLLETTVPPGSFSVFTRAHFNVTEASAVTQLLLAADYDDGFAAWINGVEVFRSPELPAGELVFNTDSALHESSNGSVPNFGTPIDVSAMGIPALHDGDNVLAVGIWNSNAAASTDLVLVPQLSVRSTLDLCDGVDNDCDTLIDEDHVVVATSCGVGVCSGNPGAIVCLNGTPVDTCDPFARASSDAVRVEFDDPMIFRANTTPVDMAWTAEFGDETGFGPGVYGIGYETSPPGASKLLQSTVPAGTASVFTRVRFVIDDVSAVSKMFLGVDYDDGFVAWINGVEVLGSPEMPAGPLTGTTTAAPHESSNGLDPNYGPLSDISAQAIPALHDRTNVLAIGVWNRDPASASTDLVLVPRLSIGEADVCDGLDNDCDGLVDEGFADGDGDGLANCLDPDDDNDGIGDGLDCHPLDPSRAAAPPSEVQDAQWIKGSLRTMILSWRDQGPGIRYDLAGGLVSDLRPAGGVAGAGCLSDDLTSSTFDDTRPDPVPGQAFYYILRAQKDGCGTGSYGLATSGAERNPVAACP